MQKSLRDGLILRSLSEGFASDRDNLGQFYVDVFGDEGDEDAPTLMDWTNDLLKDEHPQTTLDDFWVVVDPNENDQIVSAVLHIPQTWAYYDVEIPVGRVELVATHKEYRQRGLVRELFAAAHARSASLGNLVEGVTGIPHYYRRFGYTMAVDLGGRAYVPMSAVPKLKDDEQPQYTFREATVDDIPNLLKWDAQRLRGFALSTVYSAEMWQFELEHRTPGTPQFKSVCIITDKDGKDQGYIVLQTSDYWSMMQCAAYVLEPSASYLDTFDDVLRYMKAFAEDYYNDHKLDVPSVLGFSDNVPPVVARLASKTGQSRVNDTVYAWYLRAADLPKLLYAIKPVIERRLEASYVSGYTGDLTIHSFQKTAVKMTFKDGMLLNVTEDALFPEWKADAAFPNHTFLNVIFGHRSPDELRRVLPEVFFKRKAAVLLDAMFPVNHSALLPIA